MISYSPCERPILPCTNQVKLSVCRLAGMTTNSTSCICVRAGQYEDKVDGDGDEQRQDTNNDDDDDQKRQPQSQLFYRYTWLYHPYPYHNLLNLWVKEMALHSTWRTYPRSLPSKRKHFIEIPCIQFIHWKWRSRGGHIASFDGVIRPIIKRDNIYVIRQ